MISLSISIRPDCLGGLSITDEFDYWVDTAFYNTKLVYKNSDPSRQNWKRHSDLLRPRASHSSIYMDDQIYHIAGYAKDYNSVMSSKTQYRSEIPATGRKIEVWSDLSGDVRKETEDKLFNYIRPQSFVVSKRWYDNCN